MLPPRTSPIAKTPLKLGFKQMRLARIGSVRKTARDTAETIKETARQTGETAPQTSETIRNAGKVTSKTRKGTKKNT